MNAPNDPGAPSAVTVARVPVSAVYGVRLEGLRKGTASEDVEFAHDHDPTTTHLAVLDADGAACAVSTGLAQPSPDRPGHEALQLRGMAVLPTQRRRGLGRLLVDAGVELARERGVTVVWANARDSALDFYVSQGFEVVGDGFITADTNLPHHRIVRSL